MRKAYGEKKKKKRKEKQAGFELCQDQEVEYVPSSTKQIFTVSQKQIKFHTSVKLWLIKDKKALTYRCNKSLCFFSSLCEQQGCSPPKGIAQPCFYAQIRGAVSIRKIRLYMGNTGRVGGRLGGGRGVRGWCWGVSGVQGARASAGAQGGNFLHPYVLYVLFY